MNSKLILNGGRRLQRQRSAASMNSFRAMLVIVVFAVALMNSSFHHHCPNYGVAAALTTAQRRAIALSNIRRGMHLSQDAKHNVTAAEEACSLWENILSRPSVSSPSESVITKDVLSLSKTLYASCLVRVGRDAQAVLVYESCLNNPEFTNQEEAIQWRLSKARCLQRLLKYSDAAEEFERVVQSSNDVDRTDAAKGASTCILRSSGNVASARKILTEASDTDSALLSICLEYLETGKEDQVVEQLSELLFKVGGENEPNLAENSFLVYRWIRDTLNQHSSSNDTQAAKTICFPSDDRSLFMELIRINTSPLDDPGLLILDDKIELHNLLTTTTNSKDDKQTLSSKYWPESFVIPKDLDYFADMTCDDSQVWISKSAAGYGSHGNQILTMADARKQLDSKGNSIDSEPYLLQKMVDPLMLLDGYKFSLRIYVVFFSSEEAYISSKGLVKLASMPLGSDNQEQNAILDTKMHMTNSGRETVMRQEDLDFLWKEFDNAEEKEDLWKDICRVAADSLLVRYPERQELFGSNMQKPEWKARREQWGIPKILGLDFVVKNCVDRKQPWLVEVNRFPGLEPRDDDDRKIKYKIVRDAWKLAAERQKDSNDAQFEFDSSVFDVLTTRNPRWNDCNGEES